MSDTPQPFADTIQVAVQSDIDKLYFNGFALGLSQGDVNIVLIRSGINVAVLNCSYTVAKTLAQKLAGVVQTLENKTGTSILTTEQIAKALEKNQERE
jgi:hypothetical protein